MILLDTEFDRRRFLEVVPPILDFVSRMEQEGRPVLVHCYYGRDRTGCVLACCLVARRGLPAETAIEHIRALQPEALTAPGYAEAVELFDRIHQEGMT
jgi:protein-tyrosine phosphatase